ncbi:MAG TPA: L,D-transpeptidase family protein [Candidatus Limnocylindrales bacterium]|nr:L,D-transpeptidase family protein [Candidatus Limnocylindrales bacterium]
MRILRADDDVLLGDGWHATPLSRCAGAEAAEARVVRAGEPPKAALGRWRWLRTALLLPLLALLWLAGPTRAAPADPVWLDAADRPNASARDALRLLADAGADGLAPRDYRAAELAEQAAALDAAPGAEAAPQPAFERDLDAAMRRYLHDLHLGRIDPRALGFRVARPGAAAPDFAALLQAAAAAGRLPQVVAELRPRLGQYAKLREALARYRVLAADGSLGRLPVAAPVKPGEAYRGGAALHQLLVALGDLPADAPPPTDCDDAALAEGVRRFQTRHGLAADGVIGRATLAALNVPLAHRVHQLELALERLRWLPDLGARPFVGINIPMFRLWAWDPAAPAGASISMGVVVGRALNTQTPVLSEEMRYLIFRPYWNVPRSILRNDVLPALARDPGYLQRNDMEIVRGAGDDAQVVAASNENLAVLRQGGLRLRQRPGPKNSLGLVKFIFPNDANVYLHDTPAAQLFGRARRDFSHGCVRVEDPVALAQWVLRDEPGWTRENIQAAMAGTSSLRVDLARPLPVILFYMTAMVMPADQALHFADDLYGHDTRLARALASLRVMTAF